jgi:hypothetical protein
MKTKKKKTKRKNAPKPDDCRRSHAPVCSAWQRAIPDSPGVWLRYRLRGMETVEVVDLSFKPGLWIYQDDKMIRLSDLPFPPDAWAKIRPPTLEEILLPNDEAIHGGKGSPNSKKNVARRWMSRLVIRFVDG